MTDKEKRNSSAQARVPVPQASLRLAGRGRIVGREFAGDQAGGAAEGEIEEAPLDEDDDSALEFDDVDEVDEEPDEPGDEAGNMNAENVGDGGGAADDGHVAFVEIFEGRKSAAGETGLDDFAGVAAALDGDLSDTGERVAFFVVRDCEITEYENFGVVGDGEIRIDLEAAAAIGFGGETFRNFAGEGSGGDAAGPEDGAGGEGAGGFAVLVADAIGTDIGNQGAKHNFDAEIFKEFFCFCGKVLGIGRENARAAFHENDARILGADAAEIVLQGVIGDFGDGAGELETGGASADNDEGEPGAFLGFGFGTLGALECVEEFVAHAGGFFDGLEAGSVFAPVIVAVVGGLRACGDDEGVVGEGVAIGEEDFFVLGINVNSFAKEDLDVFLAAEDGADRGGDFSGREGAGGNLIEEGLKEMEIAFVEEGDVDVGAFQGLRGDETRETSAEDQDAVWRGHGGEDLLLFGASLTRAL